MALSSGLPLIIDWALLTSCGGDFAWETCGGGSVRGEIIGVTDCGRGFGLRFGEPLLDVAKASSAKRSETLGSIGLDGGDFAATAFGEESKSNLPAESWRSENWSRLGKREVNSSEAAEAGDLESKAAKGSPSVTRIGDGLG